MAGTKNWCPSYVGVCLEGFDCKNQVTITTYWNIEKGQREISRATQSRGQLHEIPWKAQPYVKKIRYT